MKSPCLLSRCLLAATILLVPGGAVVRPVSAAPSSNRFALTVSTDRADAIYRQGETVNFTIKLLREGEPADEAEVQWTITKDGVPPMQSGKAKLSHGTATVTGKLDEPGSLQCRATFQGTNRLTRTAVAGAAVDPLLIKPSLPVPADFDEFWAAQKRQLAAVPVNARLTPVKSPATNVASFDLLADSAGAPVSGYFARPAGAKPRSLPVILTVHGAGVRSSSLGGAAGWAARGFLALDINAHGLPNGRPESY